MFNDLKRLLMAKLNSGGSNDKFQNKGERISNNVNVLKLWLWSHKWICKILEFNQTKVSIMGNILIDIRKIL